MAEKEYKTFKEFYPHYLNEHNQMGTRVMHFIGTTLFLLFAISAVLELRFLFLFEGVFFAYFFAWISHFFIEKNKPATFKYPWMSLKGDFKLYFEILTGKRGFKEK
jgi:hypothetical protein